MNTKFEKSVENELERKAKDIETVANNEIKKLNSKVHNLKLIIEQLRGKLENEEESI